MRLLISTLAAAALCATTASLATAAHAKHARHKHARAHHSGIVLVGKGVNRAWVRRGPPYGLRFGFMTYYGDPFYGDDYFDGRNCYYLHHKDFCAPYHPRYF